MAEPSEGGERRARAWGPASFGVELAGVTILLAWPMPDTVALAFLAIILGVAVGAYLGFGAADPRPRQKWLELAAGIAFVALGVLGFWISPLMLAAAYVLHAAWDVLHHAGAVGARVVSWLPWFCLVYDLVLAVYIIVRF